MKSRTLLALAVAATIVAPTLAEAQSRRGTRPNREPGVYRPWNPGWDQPVRRPRVRRFDNSGWPYGYPNDYQWPYGRSYDLGNGRLHTPYGARIYPFPNGVRVYLPR